MITKSQSVDPGLWGDPLPSIARRVYGSISWSTAAAIRSLPEFLAQSDSPVRFNGYGSVTSAFFRPPPGARTRSDGCSVGSLPSSILPRRIVAFDTAMAAWTALIPPRPHDFVLAAMLCEALVNLVEGEMPRGAGQQHLQRGDSPGGAPNSPRPQLGQRTAIKRCRGNEHEPRPFRSCPARHCRSARLGDAGR